MTIKSSALAAGSPEASRQRQHKRRSFRFKADPASISDDGTFSGYGSVFNVVDSYGDVVLPGAFKSSVERYVADGSMPALLWQHLSEEPIGVWTEMREDEHGLWCKGRLLPEVARGREALALLRAGAINGLSIGYEVAGEEPVDLDVIEEKYGVRPPENATRVLSEIDLWEVSLVTFPACPPATVDEVRSRQQPKPAAPPLQPYQAALVEALTRRNKLISRLVKSLH